MKGLFSWIVLFFIMSVILGWAQWGTCWMFCEIVIRDQKFFWPLMGIPLSFNIGGSFLWMGAMANKEDK